MFDLIQLPEDIPRVFYIVDVRSWSLIGIPCRKDLGRSKAKDDLMQQYANYKMSQTFKWAQRVFIRNNSYLYQEDFKDQRTALDKQEWLRSNQTALFAIRGCDREMKEPIE